MHPLYYEWPGLEDAFSSSKFTFDDDQKINKLNVAARPLQYLFGHAFMVAPVQTPATIGVASTAPAPTAPGASASLGLPAGGDDFTLFKGQWCGSQPCMHSPPIGGIQPCPSYEVCEARCKVASPIPCLAFDFQSGKCYQWPCYALEPTPNADQTTVCGNRSRAPAPPSPGPPPPPPPPPPSPPPPPPPPLPPPKKAVGIAVQDVWIPPGDWVHWQNGKQLRGPQVYANQNFTLADVALYARLGAVVPLKDAGESARLAPNTLVLVVVAGAVTPESNGSCQVYEDDGESTGYLPGSQEFTLTEVAHRTAGGGATVHIKPSARPYAGAPTEREYRVEYRNSGAEPSQVRVNGALLAKAAAGVGWGMRAPCTAVTCTYDAPAVIVRTAKLAAADEVMVELAFK